MCAYCIQHAYKYAANAFAYKLLPILYTYFASGISIICLQKIVIGLHLIGNLIERVEMLKILRKDAPILKREFEGITIYYEDIRPNLTIHKLATNS
jgi:hypothetical protein